MNHARSVLAVAGAILVPALGLGLALVTFPLLVVPWTEDFHVARGPVMSVLMVTSIGLTLSSPVVGWLVTKVQPRIVMVVGGAMIAAGLLIASFATNFWMIGLPYAGLVGPGVAMAGSLPARTVAIRHFPQRAGALSGLISLGTALLGAVIPIFVGFVLTRYGWRPLLQGAAGVAAFTIIPLAWLLMIAPQPAAGGAAHGASGAEDWTAGMALRKAPFWLILAGVLPILLGLTAVQANMVVIAKDAGIGLREASWLVSIVAAGASLGSVLVGWLADRVDLRLVYGACSAAAAVSVLSLIGQSHFSVFAISSLLFGLSCGGAIPLMSVLVIRCFGVAAFPRVAGLLAPFLIPSTFGSVLAGAIRDRTGSYDAVFVLVVVLLGPGLLAMLRLDTSGTPRLGPAAAESRAAAE